MFQPFDHILKNGLWQNFDNSRDYFRRCYLPPFELNSEIMCQLALIHRLNMILPSCLKTLWTISASQMRRSSVHLQKRSWGEYFFCVSSESRSMGGRAG